MVLSTIVLASNSRFGSMIVLQNLAHDIALSIRSAQVYGIAVRRCDPSVGPCTTATQFSSGYGMHFQPGADYELFVDADDDGIWDPGETVESTTIGGGYTVSDVCAPATSCAAQGVERVDILFRRPEPDACISDGASSIQLIDGKLRCVSTIQRAVIKLESPRAEEITVVVESSGQISVQ